MDNARFHRRDDPGRSGRSQPRILHGRRPTLEARPDPFGDPAYTQRQRDYATAYRSSRIYTPQMIVNGRDEFVGSRQRQAEQTVARGRGKIQSLNVTLTWDGDDVVAKTTLPEGGTLRAVVVEDGLSTTIERGENAGRTLSHAAVARAMVSADEVAAGEHELRVSVPSDVDVTQARVVLFVEAKGLGKVHAAGQSAMPPR
ncbi:MAG: DUF1223 domain-containing protein [Planctomycetota bacterium]